ncbi:MAG: pyridoxal-phosphate dependent enzyme [Deltaproteobacteria bacterium]|nr:pyridoxal-phosphate dependent enzyme [Deltaproteobacteria bacterium]
MRGFDNVLRVIGRTPMVQLHRVVDPKGAKVFVKLEYLNPGGSIKDRMALYIIEKAEKEGRLKPGGTIVENTSGNTGMGLALIGAVKGYRLIFTIPDKMSQEKINFLRAFGAKVVVTPTNVPADHPDSYYETAKRIAAETPNSFYVNQYHNTANIEAHEKTTAPEIWDDTDGHVDVVVAGMGTGGTISGVGRYFKKQAPGVKIVGVDPEGSVFYSLFKTGKPGEPHVYKVEGIGEDMTCDALDLSVVDDVHQVNDKECFLMTRRLAREEGLFCGGSSGGAVHIAAKIAAGMRPDQNVVALLPDSGDRYVSKLYSDEWMRVNGFLDDEAEPSVMDLVQKKAMHLVTVDSETPLARVVELLKEHDISQAPVMDGSECVGIVSESLILSHILGDPRRIYDPVQTVVSKRVLTVDGDTPLTRVTDAMLAGDAVLVRSGRQPDPGALLGIVTKIDLIDFYSRSARE